MRTRTTPATRGDRPRANPLRLPREALSELRRVTWPTREEAVRLTIMVLVVSAAVGLLLGAVDYLFNVLVTRTLLAF